MIKDKLHATPLRKVKKQYLCGVPSEVEKKSQKNTLRKGMLCQ